MTKKEKTIFTMMDHLTSTVEVTCSKCKKITMMHMIEDYDAAEKLINDGWHATPSKALCPKCNNHDQ